MNTRLHSVALAALLALTLSPPLARAQSNLPILTLHDAEVFEGDSGTTTLVFSVTLDRPSATTVSALVSLSSGFLTPVGTAAATAGAAPGSGVDFLNPGSVPVNIRAGATAGSVTVTVFGDPSIEPDEVFALVAQNIVGARTTSGSSSALGLIRNDDGPPRISIADISASEPFGKTKTRNVNFTVTLSHPKPGDGTLSGTTVHFATVPGTATAGSGSITDPNPSDYGGRLGTLDIPQGATSGQISVPIFGDDLTEPDETFQVTLSNATGGTIADGSATCTIRDFTLTTGAFDFAPDKARVPVEETQLFTVIWTVPEGEVWRALKTIDLRLRDGHDTALYVRWDEASNTFSLAETRGKKHDRRRKGHHHDGDDCEDAVTFGHGQLPGSNSVLETKRARLDLAQTTVTGSGPDGVTVTLQLALSFPRKSAGHAFRVEVAASDDLGHTDTFTKAGTVYVECAKK